MLDLRSMSDEEFTVLVTPIVPQATMRVIVEETGGILLSSKIAEKLSKTPVLIQFNQDYTAIQIMQTTAEASSIVFPKSGRKAGLNAAEILKQNRIPLPAVFYGCFCADSSKWWGERQQNPILRHSQTTRSTKKN